MAVTGATPRLVLDDYSGDARIVVGAADAIRAKGHSTVRAFNDVDAGRFHTDSPLELKQEGDHYVLRIRLYLNWASASTAVMLW